MIALTISSKLPSTDNALLFSQNLNKVLREIGDFSCEFNDFCKVCRIFRKRFDPIIDNLTVTAKIRFEIHSGSLIKDYGKLAFELNHICSDHKRDLSITFLNS